MLSVASAINLSAQTTYKARVINQDTGEPIIGLWSEEIKV